MAKKTIMVVDDEPTTLQVVKDLFESEGYRVITAGGGKDALNILKKSKVDLILLDIMMPSMDGWDVCEKIKADKKTEKIQHKIE